MSDESQRPDGQAAQPGGEHPRTAGPSAQQQPASHPQAAPPPQAMTPPPPRPQAGRSPMPPPPPPPPAWPAAPAAVPGVESTGTAFRRGFGLGSGIGVSLLVVSLVGGLLSGLLMLAFAGAAGALAGGQSAQPLRTLWGDATDHRRIRAVPVTGAIMTDPSEGAVLSAGTYGYEVAQVLDGLDAEDADAVVLLMNTPGGSVTGSRAMHDAVDRYRQRTGKKVYAYVQGMSASGGMYTMANADEIVADHGSLVGSIGVIMGPIERYRDVTALTGTILTSGVVTSGGITAEYITAGRGKDAGSPWRDMTAEERATFQSMIDYEYEQFVRIVSEGRGIDRSVIVDELGASILGTARAEEVGLIDATMGRDEAFRHFAEASGLDPNDTRVVTSAAPSLLNQLLGADARVPGAAPAVEPREGQPARPTSSLCTDRTAPLVWHGSVAGVCG